MSNNPANWVVILGQTCIQRHSVDVDRYLRSFAHALIPRFILTSLLTPLLELFAKLSTSVYVRGDSKVKRVSNKRSVE